MVMTVQRVLPWRRERPLPEIALQPVLEAFNGTNRRSDHDMIVKAFEMARAAHEPQRRKSGEPYITHPLAVARIVASLGVDVETVAAALLHDAVEDTGMTLGDIETQLNADVASLVDGVTKLDRVRFDSKEAQQAATFRKMLVAMSKDLRVLIIKLCDRLHNLRTIGAMPAWKQERTARETLEVYAPLAHRLGMQEVKTQLEDLAFAALHPKRYAEIEDMVAVRAPERDFLLTQLVAEVEIKLSELNIEGRVSGREKHLYSIYEKMMLQDKAFAEIHDLIGIRVVVDSIRDCYAALGSIHATWKPVQGRFKDYVAMPKFNLYQSLHTTVIGPLGKPIEVQIRTYEMHDRAERGVAAHFVYKDRDDSDSDAPWLQRIIDWDTDTSDPSAFMDNLKVDLDSDEIYIFTPAGDVVTLHTGATAIDFAYAIHTDVGHKTVGAKVDGRLLPLSEVLESGQTVEVLTAKGEGAGPSKDWLAFAATPRAKSKIKQWFSKERRSDAIAHGNEAVTKALNKANLPHRKLTDEGVLDEVASQLNYDDLSALYAAVGEHHVSPEAVVQRIRRLLDDAQPAEELVQPITARRPRRKASGTGVHVEGLDDVMVRLSRCCTPVPGDEIQGFVTRGRGVSVHRADCANALSLTQSQNDRLIDVAWSGERSDDLYVAAVEVKAYDRAQLLSDLSAVFAEHHINIVG
ncbi:MAG: bifunctional (p)ppGpp synthetase/guanosine-3',5'-bis(diphosphate) 3'-pyrophosphohydrolase, partial [Acidimicrobiales bacterium]|nr:bifunctional (p)ppGpp synthetase/guanosine-3',5'-bis(diphosphate) 3'-pyrophosphohydrolase [Acidimicrobiales bacterium]